MGPKNRWEQERLEGKNQRLTDILEAAKRVFVRKGLDKSTMQDVAKEANIGVATVFRYFPKKEKLIVAVATQILESQMSAFEVIAQMPVPCLVKVEKLLDLFISFVTEEHSDNTKLIEAFESYTSLLHEPMEDIAAYEEVSRRLNGIYSDIFAQGQTDGSIRSDISVDAYLRSIANTFGTVSKKLSAQRYHILPHLKMEPEEQLHILKRIFLDFLRV